MIDTTDIIPAPRPIAPVHEHPSGAYGATCKVPDCGWTLTGPIRADVDEQASHHRHQHVAAHTRQLVRELEGQPS